MYLDFETFKSIAFIAIVILNFVFSLWDFRRTSSLYKTYMADKVEPIDLDQVIDNINKFAQALESNSKKNNILK